MKARHLTCGVLLSTVLLLAGCPGLRYMAKAESYTGSDALVLEEARPNALEVAKEVGRALGYHVAMFDANARMLSLVRNPNVGQVILVGSHESRTMAVTLSADAKRLDLKGTVSGEFFGAGAEERARAAMQEFKTKLSEAIRK